MDLIDRAGDLKGELVSFAMSPRFDTAFRQMIFRTFPDGVVDHEPRFAAAMETFLFDGPNPVVDEFVADRPDLPDAERDMLLGWKDGVHGVFEIKEREGVDALISVNLVDELTYRIRSNMGAEGLKDLAPGWFMLGGIVPVGTEWMISGLPLRFEPGQADDVLPMAAEMALKSPASVFRNPEKLAQGRKMQAEQRDSFIELHGGDLIVVPGHETTATLREFYEFDYKRKGSPGGPEFHDPGITLPEEFQRAETVAFIYDKEDGLGFYLDFALAEEVFAKPSLIVRGRYRDVISSYLREEDLSPVPLQRLAERDLDKTDLLFRKLLKKSKFSWEHDGEALLAKYKPDYFAAPPLPRVTVISERLSAHFRKQ